MLEEEKVLHLPCDCGRHLLQITCWTELMDDDNRYYQTWDFAMFDHMGNKKPSLLFRIKTAWKTLIKGYPYSDQLVLSNDSIDKLTEFIKENKIK